MFICTAIIALYHQYFDKILFQNCLTRATFLLIFVLNYKSTNIRWTLLFFLSISNCVNLQWSAKKIAVAYMRVFEPYLSSVWMDSSETFLGSEWDASECSVSKTVAKVSLWWSRGTMIRVPSAFSVYWVVILHYRSYDNRWSMEIVFLAKVFVHGI